MDEILHMQMKRPVAPLFSVTHILKSEEQINKTMTVLFNQLDRRYVNNGEEFDLAEWLQYFAFDSMSNITISRAWGFLEKGSDYNGLLNAMWNFIKAAAPVITTMA